MKYIPLDNMAAAASSQQGDLFGSLGIDWKLLVIQSIAFLLLLFVLKKLVYPPLVAMLDKKDAEAKAVQKAAQKAEVQAAELESKTAELLQQAKAEAAEIVGAAKDEAALLVKSAEDKARAKAEAIVQAGKSEIDKEVESARKVLFNDTVELVAMATEKVIGASVKDIDTTLIERSVKEVAK